MRPMNFLRPKAPQGGIPPQQPTGAWAETRKLTWSPPLPPEPPKKRRALETVEWDDGEAWRANVEPEEAKSVDRLASVWPPAYP